MLKRICLICDFILNLLNPQPFSSTMLSIASLALIAGTALVSAQNVTAPAPSGPVQFQSNATYDLLLDTQSVQFQGTGSASQSGSTYKMVRSDWSLSESPLTHSRG